MAAPVKETFNRVAKENVVIDFEQQRQEHRLRDALEDDGVVEALKRLHHDRDARSEY